MGKYPRSSPDVHEVRKIKTTNANKGTLTSDYFKKCCKLAGVEATKRQASKFNNGYGSAFAQRFEAKRLS